MPRYPLILQHSREDCGVACLASIAKRYGRTVSFTRIREAIGTGQLGTTMLWQRRGKTTILISHRPNVIALADWVVFLEEGRLRIAGTMEDVRSQAGDHLNFLAH